MSGTVLEPYRHVLHHRRTAWMSSSLFELESQAWHVAQAQGTVVAAGLGLGLFVHAAARKPEVERILVIEREPAVVALLRAATDFDAWPKLIVLQADALAPDIAKRIGVAVNYFYADIWPRCPADAAPAETARMAARLAPKAAGWWGQELSFATWCREQRRPLDHSALRAYADGLGVPLPMTPGYLRFCTDAATASLPRESWLHRWRRQRRRA